MEKKQKKVLLFILLLTFIIFCYNIYINILNNKIDSDKVDSKEYLWWWEWFVWSSPIMKEYWEQ